MIDSYFYHIKDDCPQTFHGTCEGDMVHTYGHRFFQVVRKHFDNAKAILSDLKKDSKTHSTYIKELSEAIKWAKKDIITQSTSSKERTKEEVAIMIKRAFNEYTATEKTLRRYVVQDELLFLAAMKTIKGMFNINESEWKLGNLGPKTDGSILDKELPSIKTPAKFIIKTDSVAFVIEQRNVNIKDYGEIYRILADERLYGLLKYHQNETVLASDLKSEIEEYDRQRVNVFKDIMEYEKKITRNVDDSQLCEIRNKLNLKDIDFKVMQTFDTMNDNLTKMEIRSIRNAFCHNSYPEKNAVDNKSKKERRMHDADLPGTAKKISRRINDISLETKSK